MKLQGVTSDVAQPWDVPSRLRSRTATRAWVYIRPMPVETHRKHRLQVSRGIALVMKSLANEFFATMAKGRSDTSVSTPIPMN